MNYTYALKKSIKEITEMKKMVLIIEPHSDDGLISIGVF